MKIFKYTLQPLTRDVDVKMPHGARLLTVANQGGDTVCVWAEVDTRQPLVTRRFALVGTGEDFTGLGIYVGTAHEVAGYLVVHVYDLGEQAI